MSEHTKTPWRYSRLHGAGKENARFYIDTDTIYGEIAICYANQNEPLAEANAAFIVLACNSHEPLIAVLTEASKDIENLLDVIGAIAGKSRLEAHRKSLDLYRKAILVAKGDA